MWEEKEYVNPFDYDYGFFWMRVEHLGRYLFAKEYIQQLQETISKVNVADLGCATGYGSAVLANVHGVMVDAYDINDEYLSSAREEYPYDNLSFSKCDFEIGDCDFPKEKYNVAVSFECLEHLCDMNAILPMVYSSLVPEGTFICSVPNSAFEGRKEDGTPSNSFHKRIYEREEVETNLRNAGFEIVQVLGQAIPNVLSKSESKHFRKKHISISSSSSPQFKTKEFLEYFTYLLGIPTDDSLEKSYSYIYVCKKH